MNSYKPNTVLITGSAGFIGTNYVRMMLRVYPTMNIVGYDALTYAADLKSLKELSAFDNYQFVQGDICNKELFLETLRNNKVDTIVHFAAESHVDNSISNPEIFFKTNVVGTQNIIECARVYWQEEMKFSPKQYRFHHVSTDEVYGSLSINDLPFVETSQHMPNSPYSASKAGSDHVVRAYFRTYGLSATTSHCSNNFGPYQHEEKFIPVVIKKCISREPIPVYGNGNNVRDWLYVEDHCRAIDLIIREGVPGEAYNVGGKKEISNIDLALTICSILDEIHPSDKKYLSLIQFVSDRKGHDFRYAVNANKLESRLGYKLKFEFSASMKKTVQSYFEKYKNNGVEKSLVENHEI